MLYKIQLSDKDTGYTNIASIYAAFLSIIHQVMIFVVFLSALIASSKRLSRMTGLANICAWEDKI